MVTLCSQFIGYNLASTRPNHVHESCVGTTRTKNAASSVTVSDTTAHVSFVGLSRWLHGLSPAALRQYLVHPLGRAKHRAACPRIVATCLSRCSNSLQPDADDGDRRVDDITTRSLGRQPGTRCARHHASPRVSGQGRPCTMQTAPGRILRTYASDRAMGRLRRRRPHSEYMNRIDSSIFFFLNTALNTGKSIFHQIKYPHPPKYRI